MKKALIALLVLITGACAVAQEQSSTWAPAAPARDADLRAGWAGGLLDLDEVPGGDLVLFEEADEKPAGIWDSLQFNGAQQAHSRDAVLRQPWLEDNGQQGNASLGFSHSAGEFGVITLEGSPAEEQSRFSIGHSLQTRGGWLRGVETRVEANNTQTLFTVGGTASLYETQRTTLSARLLGGYAANNHDPDDSYHFSADVFAGRDLGEFAGGRHLIKAGMFVDQQDQFGKFGPELGLLLYEDYTRPLIVDFAYGFGYGGEVATATATGTRFTTTADEDIQLRVGTLLTPSIQVGGTVDYLQWDNPRIKEEAWAGGGFLRYQMQNASFTFDLTTGEQGVSGFASVAWQPAYTRRSGAPIRSISNPGTSSGDIVLVQGAGGSDNQNAHPWLSQGINRRTGVRTREKTENAPAAAPITFFGLVFESVRLRISTDNGPVGLSDGDTVSVRYRVRNVSSAPIGVVAVSLRSFDNLVQPLTTNINPLQPGEAGIDLTSGARVVAPGVRQVTFTRTFGGVTRTVTAIFQDGAADNSEATSITIQ